MGARPVASPLMDFSCVECTAEKKEKERINAENANETFCGATGTW
jgi:hypothetical protein